MCENNNNDADKYFVKDANDNHVTNILAKPGKFQIVSVALLCPNYVFLGLLALSPVFVHFTPPYFCKESDHNFTYFSNISEYQSENITKNQCSRLKPVNNQSLRLISDPDSKNESFSEEPCLDGWEFDPTFGNTLVTEFNLVCESAWKRPLMVASFMIGLILGGVLCGPLSDKYGRRFAILFSFFLRTALHFTLSIAGSYSMYLIFMVLIGVFSLIPYIAGYILTQELYTNGRQRSIAILCLNLFFALGYLLLPLVSYYVTDWRWVYRVFGIGSAAYMPVLWFIPESPKWLLQSGDRKSAEKLLKRIATFNKIKYDETDLEKLNKEKEEEIENNEKTNKNSFSPSIIFRHPVLRKRILLICFLWNISYTGYYTLCLNSSNLGGNIYVNCVITGISEMASYVFMAFVLGKAGRRNSFAFVIGMGGIFCILAPPLKFLHQLASVASANIGKFFVTTSMSIITLFVGELFPTAIRNTSVGIASMSRVFNVFAPFLIYFGEEINLSIPFYVMGSMCLVASTLTLFLPETSKVDLPDTLEDAIALDEHSSKLTKLCCGIKNYHNTVQHS